MADFLSTVSARSLLVAVAVVSALAVLSVGGVLGRGSRQGWRPETPSVARDVPPIDLKAPVRVATATFSLG